MTEPRRWQLIIPVPDGQFYTANTDHRAGRHRVRVHRHDAKAATIIAVHNARIPRMNCILVATVVHTRAGRRIDPQNVSSGATLKGIYDGLADERHTCNQYCRTGRPDNPGCHLRGVTVRQGIVPGDGPRYMSVTMPKVAGLGGLTYPWVELTITEVVGGDGAP